MSNENVLAGKKILAVEDDMFFLDMISTKLSTFQCHLIGAINGQKAFEVLEKEIPDAIILDLLLPGGISGFDILEKIKTDSNLKSIPVIILSNLNEPEDIEKGMRLGAFRYLTKATVSISEIIDNVKSALVSKKM